MSAGTIAIIGAGIAGLACARRLADAGQAPLVLDKGRSIGGRLATRRTPEGLQFDHGAQYVTAKTVQFQAFLADLQGAGAADVWRDGDRDDRFVGTPGMNALAKRLADGLDVRTGVQVDGIAMSGAGWAISAGRETFRCERLVITTPAPQAAGLLGATHPLADELGAVRFKPCLTLMAAFAPGQPEPFLSRRDPEDDLAWIALNSSKPGRTAQGCWVAQAGPAWSAERLERDLSDIAHEMSTLLCDRLGADLAARTHAVAHRWRYANVAEPLGRPFLRDDAGQLYLGGDWCLKARVEAAWTSGRAIAEDLLKCR